MAEAAAALLVEFGATDEAVIDVITDVARAEGRLPFDLPRSTAAAAASRPDAPFDTDNPVFRYGDGIL
ncbi:hypothetical protein [Microbacterium oxydans]|uniref:hypothetical protein n=1 Tax=Microbacterium oxydans TaxID=82380 RepID=UPI0005ECF994|nr:hypothetical protein [Microbacterium oxydans]